jgi:hypothetical protein
MINSFTGGLEFPSRLYNEEESDIEKISELDINSNFNPLSSL